MCVCVLNRALDDVHSHSSIKASAAGVDEASDHRVEDEGQDLRRTKELID